MSRTPASILAVQNQFDILQGEPVSHAGVREYAANAGISFIAWSPLAKGLLTEKYVDLANVGTGDRLFDEGVVESINPLHQEKIKILLALSNQWNMTLNQLTLSYMLILPGMGPVIPSSSTVAQLESNAAAGKLILTDDQKVQICKVLQ